ncbi:MAG: response regulator [Nocardioides sp.]
MREALTPLRLLLAEDNEVNRRVATLMLARLGQQPDTVGNGPEALEAVRRSAYDLVLMDVQMPVMDGLEATRRIRAELPADRQPRIVAMTANALLEHQSASFEAGMDDHLTKPVRAEDLAAVLRRAGAEPAAPGDAPRASVGPASLDAAAVGPGAVEPAVRDPAVRESAVLDPAVLDSLAAAMGTRGEEVRASLVAAWRRDAAASLERLGAATAAGDAAAAARVGHAMRGAASSVGAVRLAAACAVLEAEAASASPDELAVLVARVSEEVAAATAAFDAAGPPGTMGS